MGIALETWLRQDRQVSDERKGDERGENMEEAMKKEGADKSNRHVYIWVASSALMSHHVVHFRGELRVSSHGTTHRPVVVIVPP